MIQMRWIPGAWRSYTVFDAPHLWSLTRINKKPLRTTSKIHWKIWKSMHVVFAHFPSQSAQLLPGDPTNLTTHRSRRTDLAWLWSLVEICTSRTWRKAFRHRRKPWLLARGLGGGFFRWACSEWLERRERWDEFLEERGGNSRKVRSGFFAQKWWM